ncbi:MAG: hypothetical protein V4671_11535 [Armatimonadota bacterium]
MRERGHELHLFAPRTAAAGAEGGEYLPIAPLCHETHLYGAMPDSRAGADSAEPKSGGRSRALRQWADTLPPVRELMDTVWAARMGRSVAELESMYEQMAADIDRGGFDVAYVNHCVVTLAPDLLRQIRKTPTVFCCNDTQRSAMQWPVETDLEYDSLPETWFRKHRRGRLLGRSQRRFVEGLEDHFIRNTRAATLVLANSFYSREALAQGAGVNASVCYPGVDTDFFCPDPEVKSRSGKPTVLSVGALLPTKRHDFVLEAVAEIPPQIRPRLEIIGYAGGPHAAALNPQP